MKRDARDVATLVCMAGGTTRSQWVLYVVASVIALAVILGIAVAFDSPTSTWLLLAVVFVAVAATFYFSRHRR